MTMSTHERDTAAQRSELKSRQGNKPHDDSANVPSTDSVTPEAAENAPMKVIYKTMGELEEGDQLLGSEAGGTTVTDAYDAHVPDRMFRLRFSNGQVIEASGNHLWYTVTGLDKQLHKQRIKDARAHVVPHLNERKMSWLKKMANADAELSPNVDMEFIADALAIDGSKVDLYNQVVRILESIGPVAMRNEYIYDEGAGTQEAGTKARRIYSLKLFCEQALALVSESIGKKHSSPYELLKGKVRTTEDIAHTWELGHDFPSTGKRAGIFSMITR